MISNIRPARRADALHVAAFVDIAGHGIEMDEWRAGRGSDHSTFAEARRVVLDDTTQPYHYSRAHILEVGGDVAAGLIGGLVEHHTTGTPLTPHYVLPLIELESHAPGSWLVLVVATYPEDRGKGFGRLLMDHAHQLALRDGARMMSLVTHDANTAALKLYERCGFQQAETRPWIAYDGQTGPTKWIRMVRDI